MFCCFIGAIGIIQSPIISRVKFGIAVIFFCSVKLFWIDGAFNTYVKYLSLIKSLLIILTIDMAWFVLSGKSHFLTKPVLPSVPAIVIRISSSNKIDLLR